MLEYLSKAFLIDYNSLLLVMILTGIICVITHVALEDMFIAISAGPVNLISALYSNMMLTQLGVMETTDPVANVAFACGVGFMAGILIVLVSCRLVRSITSL